MTYMKPIIAGLFAIGLSGCLSPASQLEDDGFRVMSGSEIRSALVGNSLDGEDSDGDYVIYYNSASTMSIAYRGRTETGVWRVQGDKYCRRWETFGNGKERCVTFYRSGNQINWVRSSGEISDYSVLVRGNPARL